MTKNWVRYHQNRVLTRCNLIETQFWWYLTQFLVVFLDSWCVLKAESSRIWQTPGYNLLWLVWTTVFIVTSYDWLRLVFCSPGPVFWEFPFMVDWSSLWSIGNCQKKLDWTGPSSTSDGFTAPSYHIVMVFSHHLILTHNGFPWPFKYQGLLQVYSKHSYDKILQLK